MNVVGLQKIVHNEVMQREKYGHKYDGYRQQYIVQGQICADAGTVTFSYKLYNPFCKFIPVRVAVCATA